MKHDPCSVYIISTESNFPCKIGIAKFPQKRLTGLQGGNPERLYIRHLLSTDTHWAERIERYALYLLKDYRLLGEWVNVSVDEALKYIAIAVAELEAKVSNKASDFQSNSVTHWTRSEIQNFGAQGRDIGSE